RCPGDEDLVRRVSIVDEQGGRRLRMAHLATIGSHHVNGVAEIHTALMKRTIFADFDRLFPDRIVNITNGITPRRWLHHANPDLSAAISERIGTAWVRDLAALARLAPLAAAAGFRQRFRQA